MRTLALAATLLAALMPAASLGAQPPGPPPGAYGHDRGPPGHRGWHGRGRRVCRTVWHHHRRVTRCHR